MKNTLVQYQGGGYDGCFWEWNYGYFDADGGFTSIYHSGRNGITKKEDMLKLLATPDEKLYTYNMENTSEIKDFADSSNAGHVIGVAKWISENTDFAIMATCSICDEEINAATCEPEGYEGAGGIAIQATEIVCESCYSSHTCFYCGEFFEDNSNFNDNGYCEYCSDEQK